MNTKQTMMPNEAKKAFVKTKQTAKPKGGKGCTVSVGCKPCGDRGKQKYAKAIILDDEGYNLDVCQDCLTRINGARRRMLRQSDT
jgi:hypothetical protein